MTIVRYLFQTVPPGYLPISRGHHFYQQIRRIRHVKTMGSREFNDLVRTRNTYADNVPCQIHFPRTWVFHKFLRCNICSPVITSGILEASQSYRIILISIRPSKDKTPTNLVHQQLLEGEFFHPSLQSNLRSESGSQRYELSFSPQAGTFDLFR